MCSAYPPFSLLSLYLPVHARSVPPPRATWIARSYLQPTYSFISLLPSLSRFFDAPNSVTFRSYFIYPQYPTWYWTPESSCLHSPSVTLLGFSLARSAKSGAHLKKGVRLFVCLLTLKRHLNRTTLRTAKGQIWRTVMLKLKLTSSHHAVFLKTWELGTRAVHQNMWCTLGITADDRACWRPLHIWDHRDQTKTTNDLHGCFRSLKFAP